MMMAVVRFTVEGWHAWPDATEKRAYLASRHRHLFHVEACVQVLHDEREIEYHDFLDFCRSHCTGGDLENKSCETIARELAENVISSYPNRIVKTQCFEDGEVGAIYVSDQQNV